MRDNFNQAKRILRSNTSTLVNIVAINGCCYGRDNQPDKGDYLKLCGQRFWTFISSDESIYTNIIEPLGYRAEDRNAQFQQEYYKVINRFTLEFTQTFCDSEGAIVWERLVQFNSSE
jgi:hypothetical protein